MGHILKQESAKIKYVSINKNNVSRHSIIAEDITNDLFEEEAEMDMDMMQSIFEQMKYKVSMSFPGKINSVNTASEYVIDGKQIVFETDFAKLLDNKKILETNIRFR
jgi:hypothetical protein